MISLRECLSQLTAGDEIEPEVASSGTDDLALLKWAKTVPELFLPPEIRTIETKFGVLSRVTVEYAVPETGRVLVGCGRDLQLSSAVSRAYGEVIERVTAQLVFEQLANVRCNSIAISGSKIRVTGQSVVGLPPKGIRTSNGWAVHFHFSTAVRNAVTEALERHILLYSYLKYGWSGFLRSPSMELLGKQVYCLQAKAIFAGHRAGMALAVLTRYPGCTTGYTCAATDESEPIAKYWLRAALEAAEPAVSIDNSTESAVRARLQSSDPLEATQAYYALNAKPECPSASSEIFNLDSELNASLVVVDVQKAWGLPFPFFAAYVFGDRLIPLAFRQRVLNCTASGMWMRRVLARYELAMELPDVHPVV